MNRNPDNLYGYKEIRYIAKMVFSLFKNHSLFSTTIYLLYFSVRSFGNQIVESFPLYPMKKPHTQKLKLIFVQWRCRCRYHAVSFIVILLIVHIYYTCFERYSYMIY